MARSERRDYANSEIVEETCDLRGAGAVEGGGRGFAKQRLVLDREPTQLPEALRGRDLAHRYGGGGGPTKRAPREMHSPEPEIAERTHTQGFMTARPQRAVRYAECLAQLWKVQRLVG